MPYNGPWDAEYIDAQYRRWQEDPDAVGEDWRFFFRGFELGRAGAPEGAGVCDEERVRKQSRVEALVYRYRDIGHLLSCLDPLEACPTSHPLLDLSAFRLDNADMDRTFYLPGMPGEHREMPLREIITHLRQTYCRYVGVEYMHLQDPEERRWLRERMESTRNRPSPDAAEKKRILRSLIEATELEQYIHRRYLGQKRFSVEGADALLPMLEMLFHHAADRYDCRRIVLGMTHRGRLNVQTNILGKPFEDLFRDFEDQYIPDAVVGSGDVKYHKGFHGKVDLDGKTVDVIMADNPSHLESVDPVVEGMARGLLDADGRTETSRLMPVLLHGDAAFTGQGIVAETLNMSQLDGYFTGGTVHVVVNNQIGYTALPEDLRSTRYATDIAKSLMIPVFHVHGEDPEAAVYTIRLACDYRMAFAKDVVVELVCYRRYGHNEGDEPYFTQPLMYERIRNRPTLDTLYADQLKEGEVVDDGTVKQLRDEIHGRIEAAYRKAREKDSPREKADRGADDPVMKPLADRLAVETAVDGARLRKLSEKLNAVPDGFHLHRKLDRLLNNRREAVEKGEGIDWANAEALCFGTLVEDGIPVRLSGQDSQRGTFSQRHSVLFDTESGEPYVPLSRNSEDPAPFQSINSLLSEAGVLGFEYGYSVIRPDALTLWEAQFGDFINNAQAIVDLFIVSGESKWNCRSGLVLLLPHGYEGQGPEHSSARFERFLQLAAEENIQVCNPTTPAQYFHLLRRQAVGRVLKPLVLLTPKSLLRHPMAVSRLDELAGGRFEPVLDDPDGAADPEKVLLVSGKLYYELVKARQEKERKGIAIVRVEQIYPFPADALDRITARYENCGEWVWVQEEPANMGGWHYMARRFEKRFSLPLSYIGRNASASTATGYHHVFQEEQARIVEEAVG